MPTDTPEVHYNPFDLLGRDGDAGFDVVAFNIYSGASEFEKPWFTDGVHRVQQLSGLPVIISEFGIRAKIDGWSNKGGAGSFVRCDDPGHGYTAGERWPEVDDRVAASNCNIMQLIEAKTGL